MRAVAVAGEHVRLDELPADDPLRYRDYGVVDGPAFDGNPTPDFTVRADADPRAATREEGERILASEVEAELRAWDNETLPVRDAAAESGYSAEHLRRLARGGRILSERGPGAKSHLRVRRESLPAKTERAARRTPAAVSVYNPDEDARDIAKRLGGSNA